MRKLIARICINLSILLCPFSAEAIDQEKIFQAMANGQMLFTKDLFSFDILNERKKENGEVVGTYRLKIHGLPIGTEFEIYVYEIKDFACPARPVGEGFINNKGETIFLDAGHIHRKEFHYTIFGMDRGEPLFFVLISRDKKIYLSTTIVSNRLESFGIKGQRIWLENLTPNKELYLFRGENFKPCEGLQIDSNHPRNDIPSRFFTSDKGTFHFLLHYNGYSDEKISISSQENPQQISLTFEWKNPNKLSILGCDSQQLAEVLVKALTTEHSPLTHEIVGMQEVSLRAGINPSTLKKNGAVGPYRFNLKKGSLPIGTCFDFYTSIVSGRLERRFSGFIDKSGEAIVDVGRKMKLTDVVECLCKPMSGEPFLFYVITQDKKNCFATCIVPRPIEKRDECGRFVNMVFLNPQRNIHLIQGKNFKPKERVLIIRNGKEKSEVEEVTTLENGTFIHLQKEVTSEKYEKRELRILTKDHSPIIINYSTGTPLQLE